MRERASGLQYVVRRRLPVDRSRFANAYRQIGASKELHRDEWKSPKFTDLVCRHNVRVRQLPNKMHLSPKSIANTHVVKDFDRSRLTTVIVPPIDIPLTATPQWLINNEPANLRPAGKTGNEIGDKPVLLKTAHLAGDSLKQPLEYNLSKAGST